MVLLALLSAMFLAACSEDSEPSEPEVKQSVTVELMPVAKSYVDVEPTALTRAWTPQSPYVTYETLNSPFNVQTFLRSMGVFFTKDGVDPVQGAFFYGTDGNWRSSIDDIEATTYYVYGYSPTINSVTASISSSTTPGVNTTYSEGAVITLSGLPSVTPNDVCVIVGAKAGSGPEDDTGRENGVSDGQHLKQGQFAVKTSAQSHNIDNGSQNYIFLLFDHLYSAMRLCFKVDPVYNDLRTIVLKEIWLKPYKADSPAMSKATAVITLKATDDGSTPIRSIAFTYDTNSGDSSEPIYQSDTGVALGTDAKNFRGGFVPKDINKFLLISKYDVYDKNQVSEEHPYGNLVRQDCTVENMLDFTKLFKRTELDRGYLYTVNLTIKPTYLYVLSEPDLDNPSVEQN